MQRPTSPPPTTPKAWARPSRCPTAARCSACPAWCAGCGTRPSESDGGGFCGVISLRWAKDLGPLPPHVLGHIGYSVVPWKQRRGHATRALGQLLPLARGFGLREVDLTTDADNLPSQRVITANGGVLVEAFTKPAAFGGTPGLRFGIRL